MDQTPETAPDHDGERTAEARRRDVDVRVRRAPKYGTFLAIGALVGAVAMWVAGMLLPPGVDEAGQPVDTTPVIGLTIVIGFVLGAGLGGLIALIIDRRLAKRGTTLVAEQVDVEVPEPVIEAEPVDEDEGAVDASFDPLDDEPQEPAEPQERLRRDEA